MPSPVVRFPPLPKVHIRIAEAASATARWGLRSSNSHAPGNCWVIPISLPGQVVDALAAHVLLGALQPDAAVLTARRALDVAAGANLPDTGCQALEVIGRVARNRDLMEAEAAFTRQLDIATTHGMAVWVVRATRELGAVDPMSANRTERLRRARGRRLNGRSVDVPATGRRSPSRASAPGRSSRLNSMMHRVVAVAGQRVGVAAADNIVGPRG